MPPDGAGRRRTIRAGIPRTARCAGRTLSPTFGQLQQALGRHVALFARSLDLDLAGRELATTDCWVNIMPRGTAHGLHIHPLSTISGTYYVQTPPGCPGLKVEDPRLERMMAAPPRRAAVRRANQRWVCAAGADGQHAAL